MIRPLDTGDFDSWLELWHGYLHFYRGEVDDSTTAETFRRLTDRRDGFFGLVAETDKELVGLAHCIVHPSTWSSTPYCYLEDLFVSPAARGTGAAKDLIEAVYAEADSLRAARVYWETQEFNAPARSLYDTVAHRTSFVVYER